MGNLPNTRETLKKAEKLKIMRELQYGSITKLLDSELPPIQYHIDELIPESLIVTLYGPTGQFKTSLALYLTLCAATKKDTFYYKTNKSGKILWIDEEMGLLGLKEKVSMFANGLGVDFKDLTDKFYYSSIAGLKLDTQEGIDKIKGMIINWDIDIVVVDSISKVIKGDENRTQDVSLLLNSIRQVSELLGVSFILIHHTRKNDEKISLKSLRGSSEFENQVDFAFSLESVMDNRFKLSQTKHRYKSNPTDSINFEVESTDTSIKLKYIGLSKDEVKKYKEEQFLKLKNQVLDWIIANPQEEYIISEIIPILKNVTGRGETYIRNVLYIHPDSLKNMGVIAHNGGKLKFLNRNENVVI